MGCSVFSSAGWTGGEFTGGSFSVFGVCFGFIFSKNQAAKPATKSTRTARDTSTIGLKRLNPPFLVSPLELGVALFVELSVFEAAVVARELKIPCIVGTGDVTKQIPHRARVSVMAKREFGEGKVYLLTK